MKAEGQKCEVQFKVMQAELPFQSLCNVLEMLSSQLLAPEFILGEELSLGGKHPEKNLLGVVS